MKSKIINFPLILIIFTFCFIGCTPYTESDINAIRNPIISKQTISAKKIDIRPTSSYFYEFEYNGHLYLTNIRCNFILHLPSCKCYNKSNIKDSIYVNPFINE